MVAQRACRAYLGFGEALAVVQLLFQLFQDFAEQRQPAVVGDHGDEIPDLPCGAQTLGDGIEHRAFSVSGNGRVLEDPAQRVAFLEQSLDGAQFLEGAGGIETAACLHYYIGERSGVDTDDGGHGYLSSFPPSLLSEEPGLCEDPREAGCDASFEAKVRTSIWSVLESTLICWRARAMARPAVWAVNSRRACLAAAAISCSAASTTLRISSSAAFKMRASSASASFSAAACICPISTSSWRRRFSMSVKRRFASWLAARASSKAR